MDAYLVVGVVWLAGLVTILMEILAPGTRRYAPLLGLATLAAATTIAGVQWPGDGGVATAAFGICQDGFAAYVQVFVLLGALCSLLLATTRDTVREPARGTTGLTLLSVAGAAWLAVAADLCAILVGFTCALVPLWGLAAVASERGREGALKGLVVGALGIALFGLGTALLAAATGTTNLVALARVLACTDWIGSDPLLVVALTCCLCGAGCFIAAVPFHMWFVDVVESLPIPGSLLLSGGILAASLAAVCRMLLEAFHPVVESGPGYLSWTVVLHGIGLVAVLTGNALAMVQRRIKRLVAYLAAGQVGLVLTTIAAAGELFPHQAEIARRAVGGILVFLAVYVINWVGLFVAASAVEEPDGSDPTVDRLEGLAHRHPWLTAAIVLALLCMAGMPLTAGFFARLVLLEAMVNAGWTATAVLTALSLGLVMVMTLGLVGAMVLRPRREDVRVRTGPGIGLVAALSSVTILLLGLLPGGILDVAIRSATTLLAGSGT